jgi:hypothetical protein
MGTRDVTAVDSAVDEAGEQVVEPSAPTLKARLASWVEANATLVNWAVSLAAAGLLLWAAVQWWETAGDLASPCEALGLQPAVCDEVPEFLQGSQFVVAMVGIAAALVAAVLSVVQAFLGRRLPVVKTVAGVLLGAAVLWFGIYWYGRLFY